MREKLQGHFTFEELEELNTRRLSVRIAYLMVVTHKTAKAWSRWPQWFWFGTESTYERSGLPVRFGQCLDFRRSNLFES